MKSFTIVMVLTVAFAAYHPGQAAPQYYDPYYSLDNAIEGTLYSIPQAAGYADVLQQDLYDVEQSVLSGDRCGLAQNLAEGAADTYYGAYNVASNPALYDLSSRVAPYQIQELANGVASGVYDGQDVTNLIGQFNTEVRQDTGQPLYK